MSKHQWAATGVSSYPLTHPIVGQGRFYETFRHFIHLVDDEAEKFAHVFSVIAQWGVGKSRLGYELIAQTNGTSRGWWIRGDDGRLAQAQLFYDDADRDQYLGLYVRYGQVANDYNNVDNWFAYGLYKALLPLARGTFDGSIQGQIAKEAYDRLVVLGFEEKKLASALDVAANHSDEKLYEDPDLATKLCQAAYAYLQTLGIKYVLVVLDELETAAEAATYGLDVTDIKHLDGRAIKLMGKAIKEEDPRRKLPWLRYVALCSPAIGDELREIQSTARRFELAELQSNAFSDVSDFVQTLAKEGRLAEEYPEGLVEAAYSMSAGNFGWFNVVMAGIDERLRDRRMRREKDAPAVGALFDELVKVSNRIQQHVLDHHAIGMIKIDDRAHLAAARELLYGQLPVRLETFAPGTTSTLLSAKNEYEEPVALLFRRVEWDELEAAGALQRSKFTREKGLWRLGGVDQPLDLRQLLSNLGTYAIHETRGQKPSGGKNVLLIPLRQSEFVHLVSLLYPHPAAEDAARALWRNFIGSEDLPADQATHIAPSVEMLSRLNLRHRKQGQTALIFRDPEENAAHEKAISALKGQSELDRARQILRGAVRVIDQHWSYDGAPSGIRDESLAVWGTSPQKQGGAGGGLVSNYGLMLHPKGRALFGYVKNAEELERVIDHVTAQFGKEGRTPLVAFTSSRALVDHVRTSPTEKLKNSASFLFLFQLSSNEEHVLHQVGLPSSACVGFQLDGSRFTTAFATRLQSLERMFNEEAGEWRRALDRLGRLAWPFRPSGRLKEDERQLLTKAWLHLAIERPHPASLSDLDEKSGVDVQALTGLFAKLGVTPKARSAHYLDSERAGLFSRLDDSAEPQIPAFLVQVIRRLLKGQSWTQGDAEREWFWGYTWDGAKPKEIFAEWMQIATDLGFAKEVQGTFEPRGRAELRNLVQEADNWLKQDYPKVVTEMKAVFGKGRVQDLFEPEGSQLPPGTKTHRARKQIGECTTALDELDKKESSSGALSADDLRACSERRRRVLKKCAWVYLKDEYRALQSDGNVRALDLESDSVPLWQRLRRAELLVKFVRDAEKGIRDSAGALIAEMHRRSTSLAGFPVALFTLSLEKIQHILDGALAPAASPGATELLQSSEPGTLRQNLRDLRVSDVYVQLENLAREAGFDLPSWRSRPLDQCEGHIPRTFHELKSVHEKLHSELADTKARLHVLAIRLKEAPTDYRYPASVPAFSQVNSRPGYIEDSLEAVRTEEVDRLRSDFDGPARLGNFQPLMSHASDLFEEPRQALALLRGHVVTLENSIAEYLQSLLRNPQLQRLQRGLEALLLAAGGQAPKALVLKQLEDAESMAAALQLMKGRIQQMTAEGDRRLASSGVSFERWCGIVEALDAGRDPKIESREADELINRGFLFRTYRLGGAKS